MIEEDRFCLLDEHKKPLTIANGGDIDFDKFNSAITQWAEGLQSRVERDNAREFRSKLQALVNQERGYSVMESDSAINSNYSTSKLTKAWISYFYKRTYDLFITIRRFNNPTFEGHGIGSYNDRIKETRRQMNHFRAKLKLDYKDFDWAAVHEFGESGNSGHIHVLLSFIRNKFPTDDQLTSAIDEMNLILKGEGIAVYLSDPFGLGYKIPNELLPLVVNYIFKRDAGFDKQPFFSRNFDSDKRSI